MIIELVVGTFERTKQKQLSLHTVFAGSKFYICQYFQTCKVNYELRVLAQSIYNNSLNRD